MTTSTMVWTVIAVFASYVVIQDANAVDWLILRNKQLGIALRRVWFLVRHNPSTPWVRYEIKRNADRIASEIIKENENR